jgi:DNA primase
MILSSPDNFVPTKEKVKNATSKRPCPICHKTGCGVNSKIVLCWRVESSRRVDSGAYLHFLNDDYSYASIIKVPVMEPKASLEEIDKIYDAFLDCLVLSDKHNSDLIHRGLSKETITKNKYRTTPTKLDSKVICQYLETLSSLEYVPGFYLEESRRINVKGTGLFIPYRDPQGKIRGMQIRPDRGNMKYIWFSSVDLWKGASSGSYPHYSNPDFQSEIIYITEGGLKGDCIAELKKVSVVSIAGVTAVNYEFLMNEIKEHFPKVTTVALAFDVDWKKNEHVKDALLRLSKEASKHFEVYIEDWNIKYGKGYDDFLLNNDPNKK